jgi:hypothetical protein
LLVLLLSILFGVRGIQGSPDPIKDCQPYDNEKRSDRILVIEGLGMGKRYKHSSGESQHQWIKRFVWAWREKCVSKLNNGRCR